MLGPDFRSLRASAFALFLFLTSLAAAQPLLQYNPYTNWYEYAPGAMPRYNPYTKQRELVGPGETLQYNPYTQKRQYAPKGATPSYNPYTKQRELAGPGEALQYNPYTQKREFAPGAMPRYRWELVSPD